MLKQTGKTVQQIKRADVLWTAVDTNNVMMQRANSLSHYHGTLDGLDVLSANLMPVILYLCAVHLLRIIIKKAKVQCLNNKNLLKRFVFAFTLLQNSTSFEQLEELFKDLFNMFCQGNKSNFLEDSVMKISN